MRHLTGIIVLALVVAAFVASTASARTKPNPMNGLRVHPNPMNGLLHHHSRALT
jgi:hypothetical protein